ncbi:MAG: inorganic phosphate transporter [Candidatus Heimdallarchaeota archaeon]
MAPAVGAGIFSLGTAVLLGGIFNFIGVFFMGESVSRTVGTNISHETLTLTMVFIILITMAIWVFIVSLKGIPISTTQSAIGSVLGVVLIEWGFWAVKLDTLLLVLVGWIISPLLGLVGGFCFYVGILRVRRSFQVKGYADYERQEKIASYLLALFLLVTVFSRSGNDVAKAIGPIMAIPEFSTNPILVLFAGGLGMCIGVIILGRRIVKRLSVDIIALSPMSALAASISVSIIMFFGTLLGIPLSGSHILVAAFIGVGFVSKESFDKDYLKEIGVSWVITTPVTAMFSAAIYVAVTMVI